MQKKYSLCPLKKNKKSDIFRRFPLLLAKMKSPDRRPASPQGTDANG